jgi:hypothetical protein
MTPFQNPSIYIGSLRIDEPITVLTDIIFCFVCFYAYTKTITFSSYIATKLYSYFFLTTGISTLVAAIIGHAFLYYFGKDAKIYGWTLGIFSISFAQFAALYNTKSILQIKLFKTIFFILCLEIIIALISTFYFWSFIVVIIHTTFSLLIVATSLEYLKYKNEKSELSKYIIIGVGVLVIASICHMLKLGFGKWFNHLDVSHVFMTLGIYSMYHGVKKYNKQLTKTTHHDYSSST